MKNEFLLLNSSAASCYMNSGSEVCFPAEAPPSCDLTCYNKTMEVIEIYMNLIRCCLSLSHAEN